MAKHLFTSTNIKEQKTCNPNSSVDTKRVLKFLASLSSAPFAGVISGQNCGHGSEIEDHANYDKLISKLHRETGKWVGMIGIDYEFIKEYSNDELALANQKLIDYWNNGGLITINYSPTNPWGGRPFSKRGGDIAQLIHPSSNVYDQWMSKLDRLSLALKQLRDSGVVVLWRPMQEMNGTWFWWGKENLGDEHPSYIAVWRHMFDYFTNTKELNNLLWVFSPVGSQSFASFPYPGNEYVDIVGGTGYDDHLTSWGYDDYCAYGKVVGFAEYGPSEKSGANGQFDNRKYIQRLKNDYPRAAYWVTWHDWPGVNMALTSNQYALALLNDPGVINRDDINWQK